jgi:hypothetical protein
MLEVRYITAQINRASDIFFSLAGLTRTGSIVPGEIFNHNDNIPVSQASQVKLWRTAFDDSLLLIGRVAASIFPRI